MAPAVSFAKASKTSERGPTEMGGLELRNFLILILIKAG